MKKLVLLSLLFCTVLSARGPRGVIVVSTGWNSAGTGKVVDYFTATKDVSVVVKSTSGSAKGRKIVKRSGDGFNLGLLPSGILCKNAQCYLTAGVEIDPKELFIEIDALEKKGKQVKERLRVSSRAQLVMPYHKKLDSLMAQKYRSNTDVGSRKGVGMAAADKRLRIGIRIVDLLDPVRFKKVLRDDLDCANAMLVDIFKEKPFDFDEIHTLYTNYARRLKPFVHNDVELDINRKLREGRAVIFEGCQGTFLDVSMGSYPYVSSSSTIAAGICTGAGVGPTMICHTLGIVQCYTTCIGDGPFPAEIKDKEVLKRLKKAHESYCEDIPEMRYGWVDLVAIREAILLNGIDSLIISKLDELDTLDEIKICYDYVVDGVNYDYIPPNVDKAKKIIPRYMTIPGWKKCTGNAKHFTHLPEEARAFVKKIESLAGIPVSYISVGPQRDQMILYNDLLPF